MGRLSIYCIQSLFSIATSLQLEILEIARTNNPKLSIDIKVQIIDERCDVNLAQDSVSVLLAVAEEFTINPLVPPITFIDRWKVASRVINLSARQRARKYRLIIVYGYGDEPLYNEVKGARILSSADSSNGSIWGHASNILTEYILVEIMQDTKEDRDSFVLNALFDAINSPTDNELRDPKHARIALMLARSYGKMEWLALQERITAINMPQGEYFSCFISYSHGDNEFASRLHADLVKHGVLCWKDDHDLRGGDYWQTQIDEAIKRHDKSIVVCSETSLRRPQVVREIIEAMQEQRSSGVLKLFPIRIDNYILGNEIVIFAKKQVGEGEWPENWVPKLRAFQIPSFADWNDDAKYASALKHLLRDLKKPDSLNIT